MSYSALSLLILLWSPGKGGSESKTRRPEFLSSQVGNTISKHLPGCSENQKNLI
jgi:hypothetical protein